MKSVEFIIVGNGLAGTLLAFEMFQNNIDFRIVSSPEKGRATEVAAGLFNPLVFKRLTKSWLAGELLPVMKNKYRELENFLGTNFYFEKDILKPLSEQEKQVWLERKATTVFSGYIHSVEDLSPVNYLAEAAGYGRVTGSGNVNLKKFLKTSDTFFRRNELMIETNFDFHQIDPLSDDFEIKGVKSSHIVFCEGAHVVRNPFFRFLKMVPAKGEILLVHAPNLSENYILNKAVFVLPIGGQKFKIGSTYEWNDLTEIPTTEGKNSIVERLGKLISTDYSIEGHLAGIRPTVADRRPVLGIHPHFNRLSVFNGLGTKGVMLAPFFAREMLKMLTNRNHTIMNEVDIARFL